MAFTALLDACVLYPAPLRDLLISLAVPGIYRPKWTETICEEWIRNVLKSRSDLRREQLERTRSFMERAVPDALITGYESLIEGLTLPDPGDRHVLAAAIMGRVDVIVTFNHKDFPTGIVEPYRIEVQDPDDFLACQIDVNEPAALSAVKQQRGRLKNPPATIEDFLATLDQQRLPRTVERLRPFAELL